MKKIVLSSMLLLSASAIMAQPSVSNLFSSAESELGNNWATFKQILNWLGLFLMGGGIIFALYCYVYDQSRMKTATISIIAGALMLAVGGAMGLL